MEDDDFHDYNILETPAHKVLIQKGELDLLKLAECSTLYP
jgi:hypothetical protein